ncbi:hypothetical protein PUN28_013035 [Cardiocondyla obscurior]|uniref:Ribosomal protein L2 n=1 Tax=Cardiocondyla obscurior TaxID=286306 RepID=A0AAW2F696_9HYME
MYRFLTKEREKEREREKKGVEVILPLELRLVRLTRISPPSGIYSTSLLNIRNILSGCARFANSVVCPGTHGITHGNTYPPKAPDAASGEMIVRGNATSSIATGDKGTIGKRRTSLRGYVSRSWAVMRQRARGLDKRNYPRD